MEEQQISELLKKHEHRFENQTAYAKAVGIDVGRLNRLLNKKGPYSLNVLNCLRFAELSGEPPSTVLRAAGKGRLATLIEHLYGSSKDALRSDQREVVDLWDQIIGKERREPLLFTMRVFAAASVAESAPPDGARGGSPSPPAAPRAKARAAQRSHVRRGIR